MTRYVLDSFSLLAHFREEPGAPRVHDLIADRQHRHWMTVINLGEVLYKTTREDGSDGAERMLGAALDLPLQLVEADCRDWRCTQPGSRQNTACRMRTALLPRWRSVWMLLLSRAIRSLKISSGQVN